MKMTALSAVVRRALRPASLGLASLLLATTARADVSLFPLFSDHAVLQASDHVPVWGKAAPGEAVTVTLGGDKAEAKATAGADGQWSVNLDLQRAGPGPFELVAESPRNRLVVADVVVGEVWLCSGQSNMELLLKTSQGGAEEAARSANPLLRQFLVTKASAPEPADTLQGHWAVAGPETSGTFTAVGYYFGKKLQADLHVPVGLVHSSWGGTPSETWTSAEALDSDPELKAGADKARQDFARQKEFEAANRAWTEKYSRQDHPTADVAGFTANAANAGADKGWRSVTLPAKFADVGLPDAGATWVQRTITVDEGGVGHGMELFLGNLHGAVDFYLNGKKIGGVEAVNPTAHYRVNGPDVKTGENILALRIFEPVGGAGIWPGPAVFRADIDGKKMPLAGPWLGKEEFALPALPAEAEPRPVRPPAALPPQAMPGYLYNAMIAPLVPSAMRGVLWYQGEANVGRAWQYRTAFPLLIKDWRAQWHRGDFPFYYCQLASFMTRQPLPGDSAWAELRDAQTATLSLPNTGEAILIDAGEENDIHPKDKRTPGERLARIALAKDYGQNVVWSGPTLDGFKVEGGGKVRLKFQHADGGLVAVPLPESYRPVSILPQTKPTVRRSPGGALEGFSVCGEDHQWHWATAANIEGDSVVLTCAEVPAPVAVRYAWADDPLCNLANGAGLPAGPFRTDDFRPVTLGGKY